MALICEYGETRPDTKPGVLHHLRATPETVHWGYFHPNIKPALRVKSGDLILAEAITHHAGDAPDRLHSGIEDGARSLSRRREPCAASGPATKRDQLARPPQ